MDFHWDNEKVEKAFSKRNVSVEIVAQNIGNQKLRFIETGDSSKKSILFIHGAPGSSRDFNKYLWDNELREKAQLIAVDRPGYGNSDYGKAEVSIKKQAEVLHALIPDSSIIIGHSLGGPVAAAIAMYYPEKVSELILLAAAVDPANEKQFFNHIIGVSPLKYLFSKAIQVTIEEKLAHEEALIEIKEDWKNIQCPTTVMHGINDRIVPFENALFLKEKLSHTETDFMITDNINHVFIWTEFAMVKEVIMKYLD